MPACDVKNTYGDFHQLGKNWHILSSFLLKTKIRQKRKFKSFLI